MGDKILARRWARPERAKSLCLARFTRSSRVRSRQPRPDRGPLALKRNGYDEASRSPSWPRREAMQPGETASPPGVRYMKTRYVRRRRGTSANAIARDREIAIATATDEAATVKPIDRSSGGPPSRVTRPVTLFFAFRPSLSLSASLWSFPNVTRNKEPSSWTAVSRATWATILEY